jgi:hypothetical protein
MGFPRFRITIFYQGGFKMDNCWIRFGCFLTGYRYPILAGCSEVAHRAVKRYTSALMIICTLWGFVGYSFVSKYLKGEWYASIFGAMLFILIILQVERQIILSDSGGKMKYWLRGLIAVIMAVIGSIVVDQCIFQEDIARQELFEMNTQVDSLMPSKEAELKRQIAQADSSIAKKEGERTALIEELTRHPYIQVVTRQESAVPVQTTVVDSNQQTTTTPKIVRTTHSNVNAVQNPKMGMIASVDQQLKTLTTMKDGLEDRVIRLRTEVELEARKNKGFLHELQVMYNILSGSGPARVVWLLWFLLLMGLEVFIMVNKLSNVETDYDVSIQHHMELQKRKLQLLAMQQTQP